MEAAVRSNASVRSSLGASSMPTRKLSRVEKLSSYVVLAEKHPLRTSWNVAVALLLVYTATVLPFRLAFIDLALPDPLPAGPLNPIDDVVDALFWIDLVVNFFFTYVDTTGKEVTSVPLIAVRYLQLNWCNRCFCKTDGTHSCTKTWCGPEPVCTYDGNEYEPGDQWNATGDDQCNTCQCLTGGHVACTDAACREEPNWWKDCTASQMKGDIDKSGYASLGDAVSVANMRLDYGDSGINPMKGDCMDGDFDMDGVFTVGDAAFVAEVQFGKAKYPWSEGD